MRLKEAIKRGMVIRKQERHFAIDKNGTYYQLYPEAQLYYGVVWKKMPKKKRKKP